MDEDEDGNGGDMGERCSTINVGVVCVGVAAFGTGRAVGVAGTAADTAPPVWPVWHT